MWQAREALKSASKEKSGVLAAALEARDAARTKAAVVEGNAARAREDLEKALAAARLEASAVAQALSAAEVRHRPSSFLPSSKPGKVSRKSGTCQSAHCLVTEQPAGLA